MHAFTDQRNASSGDEIWCCNTRWSLRPSRQARTPLEPRLVVQMTRRSSDLSRSGYWSVIHARPKRLQVMSLIEKLESVLINTARMAFKAKASGCLVFMSTEKIFCGLAFGGAAVFMAYL